MQGFEQRAAPGATGWLAAVGLLVGELADDDRIGPFEGDEATAVPPYTVEVYADLAEDIAEAAVTEPPAGLDLCDPQSDGADTCARTFIESLLPRAFHRPTGELEVERYVELYEIGAQDGAFLDGTRLVITAALQSSNFLDRVEIGDTGVEPAAVRSHTDQTSPVRRGKAIRTRMLCGNLPPPPPEVGDTPPKLDPTLPVRERDPMSTEEAGQSCHEQMDPLGFGLEHYDADRRVAHPGRRFRGRRLGRDRRHGRRGAVQRRGRARAVAGRQRGGAQLHDQPVDAVAALTPRRGRP